MKLRKIWSCPPLLVRCADNDCCCTRTQHTQLHTCHFKENEVYFSQFCFSARICYYGNSEYSLIH